MIQLICECATPYEKLMDCLIPANQFSSLQNIYNFKSNMVILIIQCKRLQSIVKLIISTSDDFFGTWEHRSGFGIQKQSCTTHMKVPNNLLTLPPMAKICRWCRIIFFYYLSYRFSMLHASKLIDF